MMALINDKRHGLPDERVYMVSDLGASFGTAWLDRTSAKSKGNLYWYSRTRFVKRVYGDLVDFEDPRRPAWIVLANPHEFFSRLGLRWIGRGIPREDAKWIEGCWRSCPTNRFAMLSALLGTRSRKWTDSPQTYNRGSLS